MNAGRFVIDGLAIPANGNAQRYREYPIGPAPGAVGLARSLFSYSNPGGGGRLARGVRGSAARLRVVRAHSQNYRPWRHIERTPCTPCWSSCCARPVACVVRPPPPPSGFANFDQSRNWKRRRSYEVRVTMSLDCAQCLDSVVR